MCGSLTASLQTESLNILLPYCCIYVFHEMDLVNLPIPVFQAIMEELLFTVGLYRVFDFRLVSSKVSRWMLHPWWFLIISRNI